MCDRKHTFTLAHAFFGISGGFAFRTNEQCCYVSQKGLRILLREFPELVPDIPEATITQLSSHSTIGKLLLIVQLTWFSLSCASRLAEQLPLSLLEVSTACHCICSAVACLLWWSKPQNVPLPIFLDDKPNTEATAETALSTLKKMGGVFTSDGDNDRLTGGYFNELYMQLFMVLVSILFSFPHSLTWNTHLDSAQDENSPTAPTPWLHLDI